MINMNNLYSPYSFSSIDDGKSNEQNFNNKVLYYLQENQPEGTLDDLLNQLLTLSSDKHVSISKLSSALLNADGQMRQNEQYQTYTHNSLDELTFRMIGLNMFYNRFIYNVFTQSDETS